jgi:multiple sugar transport system substrate-binding protein
MSRDLRLNRRHFLAQTGAAGLAATFMVRGGAMPAASAPRSVPARRQDEPVTLTYTSWELYPQQAENERQTLVTPFQEQFPNITIENSAVAGYDAYWQKIQTLYATNQAPDVYAMSVGYEWDFANEGKIIDIDDQVKAEMPEDEYFQSSLPMLRYPDPSGRLYAFPFQWVCSVLYYNKDLFDQAGVPYPDETWTYDTLLDAAKELTGEGQFGFSSNSAHTQLDAAIYANGGKVLSDDYKTCVLADSPEAIETIQWFVDLIAVHKVAPDANQSRDIGLGTANSPFQSGRVAMVIDGSWQISTTRGVDFNWDIALVPSGTEDRVIYGGPDSLSISSTTPHVEEAWEFLKYAVGPARSVESFGAGVVPIYKATANSEAWLQAGQDPANMKVLLETEPYMMGAEFISNNWTEWRITAMNSDLTPAFLGASSVEDAVQTATDNINAILAKP